MPFLVVPILIETDIAPCGDTAKWWVIDPVKLYIRVLCTYTCEAWGAGVTMHGEMGQRSNVKFKGVKIVKIKGKVKPWDKKSLALPVLEHI